MLEQVIYNLLNNAAIHTNTNCTIDISATCHADLLEIIIEDNGKGFDNLGANDILHKFSRSKKTETTGSGLGLSIVTGFTEALGGTVELEKTSASGGAKFSITVPVKTTYIQF